jgi:hypothetical protein
MTVLICIGLYVLGILGFITYEALVGFGDIDFDGESNPPSWLLGLFWFLSIPVLMIYLFSQRLNNAKQKRLEAEKEKQRAEQDKIRLLRKIRVEHEEAVRKAEQELDLEDSISIQDRRGRNSI